MHPEWLIVTAVGLAIAGPRSPRWPTLHPVECRAFHAVNGWPNGSTGSCGCRCNSATSWSARLPGWSSPASTAISPSPSASSSRWYSSSSSNASSAVRWRSTSPYGSVPGRARSEPSAGRDVPSSGPSFPSGHVILVTGVACVVAPTCPPRGGGCPAAHGLRDGRSGVRGRAQPPRRDGRPRCRTPRRWPDRDARQPTAAIRTACAPCPPRSDKMRRWCRPSAGTAIR